MNGATRTATQVQREGARYWTCEYFARQPEEKQWRVLLSRWIKRETNLALGVFEETGTEFPVRAPKGSRVGDTVQMRVSSADPRAGQLYFQAVK